MQEQEQVEVAEQDQDTPATVEQDDGAPAAVEQADGAAEAVEAEPAQVDEGETGQPDPGYGNGDVEVATPTPTPAPALLTAEEILASEDLSHVDVPVPEWTPGYTEGGDVEARCVRLLEMSAGLAIQFTDSIQEGAKSRNNAIVNIIRLTAVGDDGKKLFDDKAMARMMEKSFNVYQRLSTAALVLNGFAEDEKGEDGEGAAKND